MPDSCTIRHTGTSASAPIAAGIFALVLEANPNITWRDMQHLVVRTSNPAPLLRNSGWRRNGVGRYVNNKFGYGIIDAEALVKLAQRWKTLPEKYICTYNARMKAPRVLPGIFSYNFTLNVGDCSDGTPIYFLEHVQVVVTASFNPRGDLQMSIVSPAGTRSDILPLRKSDRLRGSFSNWPFLSVHQWGENPRGIWTLIVESRSSTDNTGKACHC
ncbi:unnamed protein product [Soboliphyme baturini]|uniref:P/Homo B domain-containing protein n=1 Tax=Soboliphyme baturini TaxID=241478 RepID=A0A183IT63_9BILA|nr:unnamed protein product [Soboliphyme baturini]